jgi:predicted phosphodiesterase
MADALTRGAMDIFRQQMRLGRAPNIAILGPPSSGKSDFLGRLRAEVEALNGGGTSVTCLKLDAAMVSQNALAESYQQLNSQLLREAQGAGIALSPGVDGAAGGGLRFEALLKQVLSAARGFLIVFVDHLESIPGLYASDLNHRFRSFIEGVDHNPEYERMGFVVAGSLSLHELNQATDSDFSMFEVLVLPSLNHEAQQQLVKDYLKGRVTEELPPDAFEALVWATRGETAFLRLLTDYVLGEGRGGMPDGAAVRSAVEDLCRQSDAELLRHIAFHIYQDKILYQITQSLSSGVAIAPAEVTPDIDRFQLSGAVLRKDTGQHSQGSYDFRNGIVETLLKRLLAGLETPARPAEPSPALDSVRKLEALVTDCTEARLLSKCVRHLREAFSLLTPYASPLIYMYATERSLSGWWLDNSAGTVDGPLPQDDSASTLQRVACASANSLKTSLAVDDRHLVVAVPVTSKGVYLAIVTAIPLSEVTRGSSEIIFRFWGRFVHSVKRSLVPLALAEVGRHTIKGRGLTDVGAKDDARRDHYPPLAVNTPVSQGAPAPHAEDADASSSLPIIIHISDPHFGYKTSGEGQARVRMHRFGSSVYGGGSLADNLVERVKILAGASGRRNIVLVVSGDIAYEAVLEEYEEAREFIEQVRKGIGIPLEHIVMVPGNHDVNWKLSGLQKAYKFDEYLNFINRVYGVDVLYKLYPYLKWDFTTPSKRPRAEDILAFHEIRDLNLILVGFNSCVMETEEKHYGVIGEDQLKRVKSLLSTVDEKVLRVAVLHHHVIPVENRLQRRGDDVAMDVSIVRDFALVEDYLHRLGFDIVLHGHKHMPALRETALLSSNTDTNSLKRIIVCGAGSAGVDSSELPHQTGNHFEILRFLSSSRVPGKPFLEIEWQELAYTDIATWEEKRRWTIMG